MNIEKKILLSCALFIAAMFGGGTNAQNPSLYQINREITRTRNSIDSVRNARTIMMTHKLQRNANYRYINENAASVDTLPRENERLLNRAVLLIRKKHPTALLPRTPVLFIQYSDVPGICYIRDIYRRNNQKINEYNRRVNIFGPEYQLIKNKCDSIAQAQVEMYQLRLDSLLNKKMEMIR